MDFDFHLFEKFYKSKKRPLIFIIFSAIIIYFFGIRSSIRYSKTVRKELNSMNLKLTGKVSDIYRTHEHGFGLIYLRHVQSNIQNYDLRGISDHYYCVIKNNRAVLIQILFEIQIGDSLKVDTSVDSLWAYRDGTLQFTISPTLNLERRFFEGIEDKINL